MATRSHVRDWINAQSPRSYFWARDVPGTPRAVESALSRLTLDPDGPIVRARQGLYWVKPARTRFGTGKPDPVATALAAAGPGSGPAAIRGNRGSERFIPCLWSLHDERRLTFAPRAGRR